MNDTILRREMNVLVVSLVLVSIGFCSGKELLNLCRANEDTYGMWNVTSMVNLREARPYFVNGYYGEAVQFHKMWFPHNCSYHRFTQASLQAVATHLIGSGKVNAENGTLHLQFVGDSATRGIMCGIVRILSGSEMFGPADNELCGYPAKPIPPSFESENKVFDVTIGNITISLIYIKTMESEATTQTLEANIAKKPYAIILNTGAWSFWGFPIKPSPTGQRLPGAECDSPIYQRGKNSRLQESSKAAYARAGQLGHDLRVKMIYRTNHYNVRYGVNCADGDLLPILTERKWHIWDNTRVSKDVWAAQTYDGFHFDRTLIHTEAEHLQHIQQAVHGHVELPGMLEMQFAQSLLHYLFRDTIQEFITKGIELPII